MKLSVWITTYNHEKYIAQALESVLSQKTDFDFNIVIGDDCSTDNTRKIIKGFADKHPNKFYLFYPDHNLGMIGMFKASYAQCSGQYIAWLDGDDFWTDPLKLQKQVDFLEQHHDYVMCFHNANVQDEISGEVYRVKGPDPNKNADFLIDNFLMGFNPVPALSVVHRNILGKQLPEWLYSLPYPDFGFYFLLLQRGKIISMKEVMGTYRIHKSGSYHGNTTYHNYENMIRFFLLILHYIPSQYHSSTKRNAAYYYFELFKMDIGKRDYSSAKRNMMAFLKHDPTLIFKRKRALYHMVKNWFTSAKAFIPTLLHLTSLK